MTIDQNTNAALHKKLPIDPDENVLAIYKHHWFAYLSSWLLTGILILVVVVGAVFALSSSSVPDQYHNMIIAGALLLAIIIFMAGMMPVYLMSQEQLVLTDESLLRVLKPSMLATKIDQLGLQHVADVSFSQDFLGTMMNYGKLTVETPGEQQTNYEFYMLPNPRDAAQQINEQHENFDAALQGGRLSTTMGEPQAPAAPTIDPQEFQEFLEFQQMKRAQAVQQGSAPQQGSTDQSSSQSAPIQGTAQASNDEDQAIPADSQSDNQQPPQTPGQY